MSHKNISSYIPIFIIMLIGLLLRMYNPFHIPFMHDELSALTRLDYPSLGDVVEYGVKQGDTHPPGVEVFLYFWTNLFGKSEFAVKFPFMIMGIASIWLIYRLSLRLFATEIGALLAAVCLAALQFPVMYGQICRPYGSGLFLSLWMVSNWISILKISPKEEKIAPSISHVIQYTIATALCAYNHHFSMLFAAIVGFTGLFFLHKSNYKSYLIACVCAVALYLPNLPITLFQLSVKGLDWLNAPTPIFFIEFLSYIFHFSYWIEALIATLFLASLYLGGFSLQTQVHSFKYRILLIVWFMSLPLIGYFYSVYRAPVVQFSMLIFGLPYFFVFLFSFFKDEKYSPILRYTIPYSLLIVIVLSLIYERKHYEIFYHQPLESLRVEADNFEQKVGKPITKVLFGNPKYVDWYNAKYQQPKDYFTFQECNLWNYPRMRNFLDSLPSPYVLSGNIPHEFNLIIQEKYPYMFPVFRGFTCEMWGFAKDKPDFYQNDSLFSTSYSFQNADYWSNSQATNILADSNQIPIYQLKKGEISPICKARFSDFTQSRHLWLELSGAFSEKAQGKWHFQLKQKNKVIQEVTGDIAPFLVEKGIQKAYLTTKINDIFKENIPQDIVLECFVENTSDMPINIYALSVNLRKGNPIIYGLVEPLD